MLLHVAHETTYHFDRAVPGALQELRLTPNAGPTQQVESWSVEVVGGVHEVAFDDHHGNRVHLISLEPDVDELQVRAAGTIATVDTGGVLVAQGRAPLWLYQRSTELTETGPRLDALLADFDSPADPIERLHALSGLVADAVSYESGWTNATTNSEQALAAGKGVCQDHTHVLTTALRQLGYSARYVSGYLHLPDQTNPDDQQASHAWAEVWVDGLGWLGLDASNGISPDERYVRLATGLDYRDAAPILGLRFGDAQESFDVALHVQVQQ